LSLCPVERINQQIALGLALQDSIWNDEKCLELLEKANALGFENTDRTIRGFREDMAGSKKHMTARRIWNLLSLRDENIQWIILMMAELWRSLWEFEKSKTILDNNLNDEFIKEKLLVECKRKNPFVIEIWGSKEE
jgi:hypothetical protein